MQENNDLNKNEPDDENKEEEEEKKKRKKIIIVVSIIGVIAILLIILLLMMLTFCKNTGPASETSTTTALSSNETKQAQESMEVTETTMETETVSATSGDTEETIVAETTAAEESPSVSEEITTEERQAPTISIAIYEGPFYSAADDVCYYRIEATVTGLPEPAISWSKDDSGSSFGPKKAQVNLNSPDQAYTLTATATNSAGSATDTINLTWGCNRPPKIQEITLMGNHYTGITYQVSAAASDPDGDVLSYQWSVSGGTVSNPGVNPIDWTCPPSTGNYNITVTVSDGRGGTDTMTETVNVSQPNSKPELSSIIITDRSSGYIVPSLYAGHEYNLSIEAYDPEGDTLSYSWTATGGTLLNRYKSPCGWNAPPNQGYYTINVTVNDGKGGTAQQGIYVYVQPYLY